MLLATPELYDQIIQLGLAQAGYTFIAALVMSIGAVFFITKTIEYNGHIEEAAKLLKALYTGKITEEYAEAERRFTKVTNYYAGFIIVSVIFGVVAAIALLVLVGFHIPNLITIYYSPDLYVYSELQKLGATR